MENKQSAIILDHIIKKSLLQEQTGLVYVDPNKSKNDKSTGPVSQTYRYVMIAIGLGALLIPGLRWVYRRFSKSGAANAEAQLARMSIGDIVRFHKDLSSEKGLAKFKQSVQRRYEKGTLSKEDRNRIFNVLDDPQILKLIRERVFNRIFNQFKRGKKSADWLIAHLDVATAKEAGPVLRQMEKDGTGGIQAKIGKEIKTGLIPGVTVKLPPVYNAESFNKVINTADKAGILEKIYGKEAVKQWKTKQTGLLNFDIKQLDNLLSFDKPGAFVFKTEVKTLEQYKQLLKQNKMSIPADPTDMAKKWKFYQLKQIFAQSKY